MTWRGPQLDAFPGHLFDVGLGVDQLHFFKPFQEVLSEFPPPGATSAKLEHESFPGDDGWGLEAVETVGEPSVDVYR